MASKRLLLINREARIIRTFLCDDNKIVIAKNKQTKRIEILAEQHLKSSCDLKNELEIISNITLNQLEKTELSIGENKLVVDDGRYSSGSILTSAEYRPEDEETIKSSLKKSTIVHVAAIALILITTFIYSRFIKEQTKDLVADVKIIEIKKANPPVKTVAVSKKKIKKVVRKKYGKRKNNKKIVQRDRNGRGKGRVGRYKSKNISNMGALGALGGIHAGSGAHLKVGSTSGNVKYGRTGKSGGSLRSVVGKGLVASGYGKGEVIGGAGRYQKRGQGGGGNGYGRHSITGNRFGFLQSLPEESVITGGLAQEQIDSVIKRNQGQMIYCYEKGLQKNKKLKGRVSLSFVINGSGKVKVANVKQSNLHSQTVENCVVSKLKRFKFPKPAGKVNVKVTYPFVFELAGRG